MDSEETDPRACTSQIWLVRTYDGSQSSYLINGTASSLLSSPVLQWAVCQDLTLEKGRLLRLFLEVERFLTCDRYSVSD